MNDWGNSCRQLLSLIRPCLHHICINHWANANGMLMILRGDINKIYKKNIFAD